MAPKKKTPPPIDRPLSKAYLREFAGWSDQFPPGQSEPNSLRVMENVMVDRNGAAKVRPGLRHLTYTEPPGLHGPDSPGTANPLVPVGSMEPFYLEDGTRAYLYAVRESDGRVGFRALLLQDGTRTVATLPECGFSGYDETIPFTEDVGFVQYVQIDNTIIAMSDNEEPSRHFSVGARLRVSSPRMIESPTWTPFDKLSVTHPDASWILREKVSERRNLLHDPSVRLGRTYWRPGDLLSMATEEQVVNEFGDLQHVLVLKSLPSRTNLVPNPALTPALDEDGAPVGWYPESNCTISSDPVSGRIVVSVPTPGRFVIRSARITEGIREKQWYTVALDSTELALDSDPAVLVGFYSASGSLIGGVERQQPYPLGGTAPEFRTTVSVLAPEGAVSASVFIGGEAPAAGALITLGGFVLCRDGEDSSAFSGDTDPASGEYFWTGEPYMSPSIHHPPVDVQLLSEEIPALGLKQYVASFSAAGTAAQVFLDLYETYTPNPWPPFLSGSASTTVADDVYTPKTLSPFQASNNVTYVQLGIRVPALARDEEARVKDLILEQAADIEEFFTGSSWSGDNTVEYGWDGAPNASSSWRIEYAGPRDMTNVPRETPIDTTLISSDEGKNTHTVGFCYTFENEVGETPASQITEVRLSRPWSQWKWNEPAGDGAPTGPITDDPARTADQLLVRIPRNAWDRAVAMGAKRAVLYAMAWSNQDAVPVELQRIAVNELYPDPFLDGNSLGYYNGTTDHFYTNGSWFIVTPSRLVSSRLLPLPGPNDPNMSAPLRHLNGIAAADRLVMVGDPTDPSTISWTSNLPGEYTSITPALGGGQKTLSHGNLQLPHAVVLWQNPQSVDTLTILCTSETERPVTYYMQPFTTNTSFGATEGMGFEETTNTPGSISPYAVEVLNNALYRPIDTALVKSTASNYNINHKVMTEGVSRSWLALRNKYRIVSAQLDNRLYYLVHNPAGASLEPGCSGNEIWVLDIAAEQGHWSRFLIQASGLRVIGVAGALQLGVVRPSGVAYLDPEYRWDDTPGKDGKVRPEPIPWRLETNLQGANRAHDAWAHVQQMSITLGSFTGKVRWGMRGYTLHGDWLDMAKTTAADAPVEQRMEWSQTDQLLVRRDLMEWYFYAESLPGEHGWGGVQLVQYRYTPTTVNVGYEHGSVETFEYGSPAPGYARDGVPQPFADARRTWA